MRLRLLAVIAFPLVLGCGKAVAGGDAGATAACSITTGAMSISVGALSETGTSLSCNGTITQAECGSSATVSQVACADGFAFIITGASETLYLRLQSANDTWSCGAQFADGLAVSGAITFSGTSIPPPSQLQPSAGTQEQASFVIQATMAGFTGSGTLQSTW